MRRDNGSDGPPAGPDSWTDISATLDFAIDMTLAAPYASGRRVINVCANGRDNVADGPGAARDRALADGIVINGLVLNPKKGVTAYFREHVQGGAGSFVIEVFRPEMVAAAMIEKLLRDLIAAPAPGSVPFT